MNQWLYDLVIYDVGFHIEIENQTDEFINVECEQVSTYVLGGTREIATHGGRGNLMVTINYTYTYVHA